jgi:hypothetical protein
MVSLKVQDERRNARCERRDITQSRYPLLLRTHLLAGFFR